MTSGSPISLASYFQRQTTRWAVIGFLVTVFLSIPCILYSSKKTSERELLVIATSMARAFRPAILEGNARDAEFQMRKILELKRGESAIVRDVDLNAVYPVSESDKAPRCQHANSYCWAPGLQSVSLLYPIYFDSDKPSLLSAYLEVTLKPSVDWTVLSFLVFLLVAAFIGQAFGLSSALTQSSRMLSEYLSMWATHLRRSPGERPEFRDFVPFTDFSVMQNAIDGLHFEISKLRESSAVKAKNDAQFALLREISHDLKTPHSLLAKYLAIHLDTVQQTGKSDPKEIANIHSTLKRMGELIRQVRVIPLASGATFADPTKEYESCNIYEEITNAIDDLKSDPDAVQKNVVIQRISNVATIPDAHISQIGFYRIFENLSRNAIEAVATKDGCITVSTQVIDGLPILSIQDNGCGIPMESHEKVLAFDFTTKPARGTGLGLGIVEKICKEFGAQLRFQSVVGKGTTFTVTFQQAIRSGRKLETGDNLDAKI